MTRLCEYVASRPAHAPFFLGILISMILHDVDLDLSLFHDITSTSHHTLIMVSSIHLNFNLDVTLWYQFTSILMTHNFIWLWFIVNRKRIILFNFSQNYMYLFLKFLLKFSQESPFPLIMKIYIVILFLLLVNKSVTPPAIVNKLQSILTVQILDNKYLALRIVNLTGYGPSSWHLLIFYISFTAIRTDCYPISITRKRICNIPRLNKFQLILTV